MTRIKGISVKLYDKVKVGEDDFGADIYEEKEIIIENVLVAPALNIKNDIITPQDLEGKKAVYTLGIPKGDTHDWKDKKVYFFGQYFKTFGMPIQGIEDLIPLEWNKKVQCEIYE